MEIERKKGIIARSIQKMASQSFEIWRAELINYAASNQGVTADQINLDKSLAEVWFAKGLTPKQAYGQFFNNQQ